MSSPVPSKRRAEEEIPRRRRAEGLSPGGGVRRGPPRGAARRGPPRGVVEGSQGDARRRPAPRAGHAAEVPRSRRAGAGAQEQEQARRGSRVQEIGGSRFGKVNLLFS